MKKAFFVVALLGAMIASADDTYLYWMVDDVASSNYNTVKIRDTTGENNYLTIWDEWLDYSYGTAVTRDQVNEARNNGEAFYASLNGVEKATSSWVIELWEDDKLLRTSDARPYSTAYVNNGMGASGTSTPYAVPAGAFPIPEPSSGLLMLVGCAVLGLRRRKQKNA